MTAFPARKDWATTLAGDKAACSFMESRCCAYRLTGTQTKRSRIKVEVIFMMTKQMGEIKSL
jgi:hypothetical protein